MGRIIFGGGLSTEIEDRALTHLQAVIMAKMRRGEALFFTWKDDPSVGEGCTSVYVHPGTPLVFKYHGSRSPRVNPAWLHALTYTANSGTGLYLVREPEQLRSTSAPEEQPLFGELMPSSG